MGRVTATVLFTDLVGSTELRGRLGEEAAEELRRRHDRLLADVVEAYSGRLVKGLGDGIMATFAGASDAVAAAVAIQQSIDRLNRSGQTTVPLAVRVGLSVGDVSFEGDDVHGTPVIEASRLCGAAGGGDILASDLVRALAGSGSEARFVSLGPMELKGLAQPVPVVRIDWEPLATSSVPVPPLLTEVGRIFVGRAPELERLTQLWKAATAGERHVVFVAGEPGVGKTRLASELAMRVHEEGATVLAGRCDEDLGVPYQPFVEALRHFVAYTPGAELAERLGRHPGELTRLVPELAERVRSLAPPLRSDPDTERYRLFDAVAAWVAAASDAVPVLLVLDDLQWAAKPTVLLLRYLLRSAEPARLLVVGTYRDTDLAHDHPLVELLAELRRREAGERLSISGLDHRAVTAFVEQAAGHPLGDEDLTLAAAIHAETEGNPFFVREVLRHLAETGAFERGEAGWTRSVPVAQLGIPEGVREVVGRRLAHLSESANRLLKVAAVIGPEFEVPVFQAVEGFDDEALFSALEEGLGARLLTEAPGPTPRYRFTHALVRDTLYEGLSAARRVALHHRVAEGIERVHGDCLDDYLPALAHHYARASGSAPGPSKAVEYARRAGDRALAQLAHDEAATYYGQAIELLEIAPPANMELYCDLLIARGEAERRAGQPSHRTTLLEAARLAAQHHDAERMARAAVANNRGAWSIGERVDHERVEVLEAALSAIGTTDSPRRARLLSTLALELIFSREHAYCLELAVEALAVARRVGDPATLGHVLATTYATTLNPLELPRAFEQMAELASVADRLGDPALAYWAAYWTHCSAFTAADIRLADSALEEAIRRAEQLAQPFFIWFSMVLRVNRLLTAGDPAAADELSLASFEPAKELGWPDAYLMFHSQQFWIRYEQGRIEELLELLHRAAARPAASPFTQAALAFALADLDRLDEARPIFALLSHDRFAAVPLNYTWPYGMTMLAQICVRLADAEHAAVLHPLLSPYRGIVASVFGWATGLVDHYLGMLAGLLGRFEEAESHFAVALETHDRMGARFWLARTRLEWARTLLARRASGDSERARDLLGQALAAARELGLGGVEGQAVALLGDVP